MSYTGAQAEVRRVVSAALTKNELPDTPFKVMEPPVPHFGDLATSVALALANQLRRPPLELARQIHAALDLRDTRYLDKAEVAEPGYLNFRLNLARFAADVLGELLAASEPGASSLGQGSTVLVEHTSANPVHPLHIGQLRNLVLGDSTARILRRAGYRVRVLNYVDESGLQVADMLVGFLAAGFSPAPPDDKKFDHYCGEVYAHVNRLYETQPELLEERKRVLKALEDLNSAERRLAEQVTSRVLRAQLETCWRAGAFYDCLVFESHILATRMWNDVFSQLRELGIIRLADRGKFAGAWVVDVAGEPEPQILVRSDGTTMYVAKDIPFAAWKIGLISDRFRYLPFVRQPNGTQLWSTSWTNGGTHAHSFGGADLAVTVIDVRQSKLQRAIAHILQRLGGNRAQRYIHLGYEIVTLSAATARSLGIAVEGESMHMAGRKGIYITVDQVLDAVANKAYDETRQRNPEESGEWHRSVAEQVALGAVRFALLKQALDKQITFDLDDALDLEGETGPYIQYAHARAMRILEKAVEIQVPGADATASLRSDVERSLVIELSKLQWVVEESARNLAPKLLTRYAYNLATAFNLFYERMPVLKEPEVGLRSARLALVGATRRALQTGLELLGVPSPPKI